ncbi:hypothetical protein PspLS_05199 [Pyricularia sp. CBS 133598]|nr:hypothetical protein PspLS_05199 [Pyricularia sp. CBS 133598]
MTSYPDGVNSRSPGMKPYSLSAVASWAADRNIESSSEWKPLPGLARSNVDADITMLILKN